MRKLIVTECSSLDGDHGRRRRRAGLPPLPAGLRSPSDRAREVQVRRVASVRGAAGGRAGPTGSTTPGRHAMANRRRHEHDAQVRHHVNDQRRRNNTTVIGGDAVAAVHDSIRRRPRRSIAGSDRLVQDRRTSMTSRMASPVPLPRQYSAPRSASSPTASADREIEATSSSTPGASRRASSRPPAAV